MFEGIRWSIFKYLCEITNCHLDRFINYRVEKKKFFHNKDYKLNLKNPQSFCEKLVWKKINDRNPLLPITADKYAVRSYVKETLGDNKAEELLVPLLHVTGNPSTIPFDQLPDSYIIKPNHAYGLYIIVNSFQPVREAVISECRRWLSQSFGLPLNVWA